MGTVVLLAWLCRVLPLEGLSSGLREACGILRSLLYLSLFAGWGISLYNRTVHPQVRRLLLNVDLLMLFWILVRTLRFQLTTPPGMDRMLWYLYYAPMLGIPVLSVQLVLTVDRSERYRLSAWARMLWLPSAVLLELVLTNDLHQQVFRLQQPWNEKYQYSWLFGLVVGWIVICILLAFGIIAHKSRTPRILRRLPLPAIPLVLLGIYAVLYSFHFPLIKQFLGDMTIVHCLMTAASLDTAMLLVTAARYMRDLRGVETRRVIYSELLPDGTSRIHDSSQLYSLFDLITAMDEFFSTGTAQKLKGYLWSEGEIDPALHTLLARINQFSDDLALCRVQALNEDLSQIAQALQAPPKESKNLTSLFFHLLNDRFRTEFEGLLASPKNNLPSLVSWCAEHRMYQQALTLLCEQMPAYVCRHLFVQPTETGWAYLAAQNQNKGKAWVYSLFHFHFCRLTLMQKEYPYTTDLRLTHSKDDADGNMLFGVANSKEMHAYMDTILASGQLVIDPEVRWQIEDAALFYQRVMQYRNQINHASDTAFGLQSDRILPLDTAHIEQTLQDVADYLQEIRPMKPDVPQGVKALPVTKTIPAGAAPNL